MTNPNEVETGLSQCHPGPLEPVEFTQQPGAAPPTGNTPRDQEMYAAGLEPGEANAKNNTAIRAGVGWLPIESAPKDGTPVLLFARLAGLNIATNSPYAPAIHVGAYRTDLSIWTGSAYRGQREIEIEPTHWMPRPAFPGCAAPGVSTVEDKPAAYLTLDEEGSPCMLFFDVVEARTYCARGKEPEALWRRPAPTAGDAQDAARYRWLRDEVLIDDKVDDSLYVHVDSPDWPTRWALVGDELDKAIDSRIAIAAQRKGSA